MAKAAVLDFNEGRHMNYANSGSAIAVGAVIVLNSAVADAEDKRLGIADDDIAATIGTGTLDTEGVYLMAAIATAAFIQGRKLYWDPTAATLTNIRAAVAAAAVAGANTGNGTVTGGQADTDADAEVWKLVCITAAANGGTFAVIGTKSGRQVDAIVGTAYDNGKIAFTINDGSTDFIVGDSFTIAVTHANAYAGRAHAAKLQAGATATVKLNAA